MLMVIFGAGASYDSAASLRPGINFPQRPPLANDLFHHRDEFGQYAQKYTPLSNVIERLRGRNSNVEAVLQRWRDEGEADKWPERLRQLMAVKYYLRDVLTYCTDRWSSRVCSATNYGPLLDDIGKWHFDQKQVNPVSLVTFNYDRLLDLAIQRAALAPTFGATINSYLTSHPVFSLFKLHGSVNWVRVCRHLAIDARVPQDVIDHAVELRGQQCSEFDISSNPDEVRRQHALLIPALAIPVQEKGTFECPESHVERLRELIRVVRKILVIGWRGTETHFLDLLRRQLQKLDALMVVDRDKAAANNIAMLLRERLGPPSEQASIEPFDGGFSDLINTAETERFLYS